MSPARTLPCPGHARSVSQPLVSGGDDTSGREARRSSPDRRHRILCQELGIIGRLSRGDPEPTHDCRTEARKELELAAGTMWAACGPPCEHEFLPYRLNTAAGGPRLRSGWRGLGPAGGRILPASRLHPPAPTGSRSSAVLRGKPAADTWDLGPVRPNEICGHSEAFTCQTIPENQRGPYLPTAGVSSVSLSGTCSWTVTRLSLRLF